MERRISQRNGHKEACKWGYKTRKKKKRKEKEKDGPCTHSAQVGPFVYSSRLGPSSTFAPSWMQFIVGENALTNVAHGCSISSDEPMVWISLGALHIFLT